MLWLGVRLSVTSQYCIEWIDLVFGTESAFGVSYIVL